MSSGVRFHSHACLGVSGKQHILLTDPWLFGKVFHRSWALRPAPDLEAMHLKNVRYVWISHAHPDHLHIPSLRRIQEHCAEPLTIFYQRTADRAVRDRLVRQGFEVLELKPRHETALADDMSLTVFPTRGDSAVVIRLGDRIILNQNDCSLNRGEVTALCRMFPHIDAWFFHFSLGGYYANAGDHERLEAARRTHLQLVARYYSALRPRIFIPFASFFYYCREGNAFLNDWAVTPAQVMELLPDIPTQVLRPGDAVLWQDWEPRNEANLAWWGVTLRERLLVQPHSAVPDSALLAAAGAFVEDRRVRGLSRFGLRGAQLEIRESGRALALDFHSGRVELLERADPQYLVISAPGDELLYFLKSPHGGDIFFGSCFDVLDPYRWRRLRKLRGYRSLSEVVKGRVWELDRQFLGASLRRLRLRMRPDRLPPQ